MTMTMTIKIFLFNIILDYRNLMVCNSIYGTTINWQMSM